MVAALVGGVLKYYSQVEKRFKAAEEKCPVAGMIVEPIQAEGGICYNLLTMSTSIIYQLSPLIYRRQPCFTRVL